MAMTMTPNRQLALNLASNLIFFALSLVIGFFFSPYIVRSLGVEANGFITLANDFVSYASLFSAALNSMAGRFISISFHSGKMSEANKYYSVVMLGNSVLSLLMLVVFAFCVFYLEYLINIPSHLIWDVKLLFSFTLLNFIINTLTSVWSTATFITNKIYIASIRNMEAQIIRVLIIVSLFYLFTPSVYFTGVAVFCATVFTALSAFYYKIKLLPELRFKRSDYDFAFLKEIVSSGIWNSITQTAHLLLSGLDLLIANLFIGSTEMGMLALAKTMPNVLNQLGMQICTVFAPTLTLHYARNDTASIKKELKRAMKITGIMLTVPVSLLITYGKEFFTLWMPSQDAAILQILSVLSCFGFIYFSGIFTLFNVFTITNKVKPNALTMLSSGVISTLLVLILLNTTKLGVFAIAGVSSCVSLVRNLAYTVPFTAKYLNMKWNTFFPEVFFSVVSVMLLFVVGNIVKFLFPADSWFSLFYSGGIAGLIGLGVNILVILNGQERRYLLAKFKNLLHIKH
jgi:O-antigen/teichoic acid export membrane protein